MIFKLGGQFNHRLVNHDGDGIQIGSKRLQAEPLSFKGNGAAARERIENCGQFVAARFFDFVESLRKKFFVTAFFPLDEFGDEAVVRDVDEFVEIHPEPIPDWLEGAWRVETNYGVITITIHGNKIAEESGGEISRGTFYYKQGKLYCDFGDGELAIRRLNMKRKCIDAGDGMLMEKQ